MLQINQGKPASDYFLIAVPQGSAISSGDEVECTHPVTGVKTLATCEAIINEEWFRIPDWVCLVAYGVNSATLKKALDNRFPAYRYNTMCKMLVLKEKKN